MSRRLHTACLGCWLTCLLVQADGGFLPPKDYLGADLKEPSQRAILVHRDRRESLLLFVDYKGEAKEFAWIIPTPTKPKVKVSDRALFKEIASYFHLRQIVALREAGKGGVGGGMGGGMAGGMGGEGSPDEDQVIVHAHKLIGRYEIAVLTAEGEDALLSWLAEHEYRVTKGAEGILSQYIREGWYFVVAKIRTDTPARQSLRPLRLDFTTKEPVYPLRISALNAGLTDIRLYALRETWQTDRSMKEDPYGDTFHLRQDFRQSCPALARAFPHLRWNGMILSRIRTLLPPQVMAQSDDGLWPVDYTAKRRGPCLVPQVCVARTVGIAQALVSMRREESEWAAKRLPYYGSAHLKSEEQMAPHAEALSRLPMRYAAPLRKQMLAILTNVEDKKRGDRAKQERLAALRLLVHIPPQDHPDTIAYLEAAVPDMPMGWAAYDQLHELGSAVSRQALFRLASQRKAYSAGVAYRYVGSLAKNEVTDKERRLACGQLWFLQAEGITRGIVIEQASELLREYTEQDLGKDWKAWGTWLRKHRPEYWEKRK